MTRSSQKSADGTKKSVFLVEDHPVFRDGLIKLLESEADLMICGHAGTARQALPMITREKPDLVVVDLGLPGKSGLELIKEIRAKKLPVKLLVVSMFDEALYAQRVLRAGGDGYIMKQEDPQEILFAIRDVLAGHVYVSEDVFADPATKEPARPEKRMLDSLTDTELEILEMLGQGKSAGETSQKLGLPETEINEAANQIRRKLKLKSHNAVIHYAVRWVESSSSE